MPFDPKLLALYPDQPGVYLMKDASGRVLYIGKAKNLKTRLKQYYAQHGDQRAMVPYLTEQVEQIDTIVALTEKDALLLENNLIKTHLPKYNILLKDDKTYVSLVVTNHPFPMVRLCRFKGSPPKQVGTVFGPYTNALAAKHTLDLLLTLFPLRQCSDAELMSRKRPCLLYDMKKCIAPCVGKCTQQEYQEHVVQAMRLLKGKNKEIIQELRQRMQQAADALEFEKAQNYQKLLQQLEHVVQTQHVEFTTAKECDVLGLYREGDSILIAQLLLREGKLVGSEHFSFHLIASDDAAILASFLLQHYQHQQFIPKEIYISSDLSNKKELEEILSETAQKHITIITPKKGKKHDLIEMSIRNAKTLFLREKDAASLKEKMLLDLSESLQLTRFPRRIECFDTSNLCGTDPVASLVCFVDGEKDKKRTRLFQIKFTPQADDYTAMKQVLYRHFLRQKDTKDFCDLLIVDGGKGHLNLALEIFNSLEIASIDVIALAKDQARHDKGLSQEKIYTPHHPDPILVDERSPMLFLLQKIRDEAHRQAITYHRKKRTKRVMHSALDSITGIGPVKKKKLLRHFGSVAQIKAASQKDFQEVEGLSKRDIDTLLRWIKNAN